MGGISEGKACKNSDPDCRGASDEPGFFFVKAICKIWPQVRFWTDNWLDGFGPLINHSIQEVPVNMINLTVADMANDGKHLCWDKFAHTLPVQMVMILAGCPPPA